MLSGPPIAAPPNPSTVGTNAVGDIWWKRVPLAYGGFAAYLLMALVHAPERIINSDCSYQLYHAINDRCFFVQEARYGMFITQLPVLAGILLHAPMKALVLLYSLGLAGSYGLCIVLAQRVFRSPAAALAILLSLVVGVGDSFCHATTETHLLLALSGLLYAALTWLGSAPRNVGRYGVVAFIVVWCLFTHPNALFTVGFVVMLTVAGRRIRLAEGACVIGICLLYFALRMASLPTDSYDGRLYDGLADWATHLSHFGDLYAFWFIGRYLENEYAAVVVLMVVLLLFLRPWYTLLLTLFCAIFFWAICIFAFPEGSGEAMMEKSFMPGIFMLAIPFAELCSTHRWRKVFTVLAGLLLLHAFINIELHSRSFNKRLAVLTHILEVDAPHASKILVPMEEAKGSDLQFFEWGTSIDALVLSRCLGDTARTIFLYDGPMDAEPALEDPDAFLYLPWQRLAPAPLDPFYFNLPRRPYRPVHVRLQPRVGRFSD